MKEWRSRLLIFYSENTRYNIFRNAYGENIGDFEEFKKFLTAKDDYREDPDEDKVDLENVFNESILNSAVEMHNRLDNWTPPENVEVIEIAGWGLDTVSGVDYMEKEEVECKPYATVIPLCLKKESYEPVYEPKFTVDGDEVVVAPSALMMEDGERVKKYWFNINSYNENKPDVEHKNILESDILQELMEYIIKKNDTTLPEYISTSRPENYKNAKPRIRMSLHSPLDVHLYDNKGRHTGPKKAVDEKGNEGVIFEEEIPNSYYYQFADRKYIGFPSGENIHIEMDGYDSGAYTLKMEEIKETETGEEIISQTTFKNLPVSPDTKVKMDILETGISGLSNLEADYNGDGTVDYEVTPVSNGEAVMPDIYPPQSQIKLMGTRGNKEWYVSDVEVAFSAVDNEGGDGTESISYSINNSEWKNYSEPLEIPQEGINNIQYFATDKRGNKEEIKSETIKIDKTAPEAKFTFNQKEQKLDIIGTDNLSQNVSVELKEKTVDLKLKTKCLFSWIFDIIKKENKEKNFIATLNDEAGNGTEIVFQKKEINDHFINVFLQSISYNGEKTDFSKSLLQYKWMLNFNKKKYFLFGSHIRVGNELLESHYFPLRNETWIMQKPQELDDNDNDFQHRPVWQKLSGMAIPYMQTEQGEIKIKY